MEIVFLKKIELQSNERTGSIVTFAKITLVKILFGVILVSLLNLHCKEVERILFDFQYQQVVTLQAGLSFLQTHFYEYYDIQTNFQNLLAAKGIKEKDVKKISPGSGVMISLGQGVNLDFIQEISIMISSNNVFNKEVLYTVQVPLNANDRIDLVGTLVDAFDVLSQDRFNMRIAFKLRANCPETFESRFTIRFLAQ